MQRLAVSGLGPAEALAGYQRGGHQDNDQNYGLHSVCPLNGYDIQAYPFGLVLCHLQ
jgi:hypothetical protein